MPWRNLYHPVLGALASVCLLAAGCSSSEDEPPAPQSAAEAIAEAITSGDFTDVPFADGTDVAEIDTTFAQIVEGMGEARPTAAVDVVTVDLEDDTRATARFSVTWPFDEDAEWSYETSTDLALVENEDDDTEAWQVAWSPTLIEPSLEPGERFTRERLVPERGEILGLDDQPIVANRPVRRIGIDKTRVDPTAAGDSAFRLATALDLDDPAGYRNRVVSAGAQAFVEAIVVRDDGSFPLDEVAIDAIEGSSRIPDTLLLAPTRDFARHVLGSSGEATAERIEQSDGRLEVGDITGLSGLQSAADDQLAGTLGVIVSAVTDEEGAEPREVFRLEAVEGETLHTSFDVATQLAAEAALADTGPPSALVAIRPSTGQVLAVASGPGSAGFSTATLGQYAPGSTFKVVTSLALLRAGLDPESPVECPDTIVVDGRSFKNYGDYPSSGLGTIPLRTALANSCNTAMIGQREVAAQESLVSAAAALGLGVVSELGVPYIAGEVPADATAVQHAASMIGQDRVLVSPLTMAAVAASVAAAETVLPTLIDPGGVVDTSAVDEPLTAAEGLQLRSMMEGVVTTGSASFLGDLPGPPAAAKTGTAEYGFDVPPRTHAWMIAIHGDLAVSVFVEDGEGGSRTAGPILEQFLRSV